MIIAVIGAHGRTGKQVVAEATLRGHTVLNTSCDATNRQQIHTLISDADAVISVIGHTKGRPKDLHQLATQAMINAMQSLPPKRYISLTGTGVRLPEDKPTVIDKLSERIIAIIDPSRLSDGRAAFAMLAGSQISWTLFRVAILSDTDRSFHRDIVSRKEVAIAMLDALENDQYIRQAPVLRKLRAD